MQLTGYNYINDCPRAEGGLARLAGVIEAQRKEAQARGGCVILCDNGDAIQGNAVADLVARQNTAPHPMAQVFNHLRYDVVGLGNHDLDFGLGHLDTFMRGCEMPVISSNLTTPAIPHLAPFALLERRIGGHKISIGIVSSMPQQTANWNRHHLEGNALVDDQIAALETQVKALTKRGVDILVVLAHCGIARSDNSDRRENQIQDIAAMCGISVVIAGHTHRRFPAPEYTAYDTANIARGTLSGRPLAQPAPYASEIAVLDLGLTLDPETRVWSVGKSRTRLIKPRKYAIEAPEITQIAAPVHDATRAYLGERITCQAPAVNSFFAMLRPNTIQNLLADVRRQVIARRVAGTPLASLPLLAATCDFVADGADGPKNFIDVPDGRFERRHITAMTPFSDQIWAVVVTGKQVLEWLEWSSRIYACFAKDIAQRRLTVEGLPPHGFDTLHGLEYDIDPAQVQRIHNARWNGQPIDLKQEFLVATTHYRASGGGGIDAFDDTAIAVRSDIVQDQALGAYLAAGDFSGLDQTPAWRLRPSRAARVIYDTAPDALGHLDEIAWLSPKKIGRTVNGITRLSLEFDPLGLAPR